MSNKNKQIAQNTLFLYLRKIVVIAINVYTSRLLLQMLGVEEFGLYGLIGSIVILFNSLRSLFASSIQRFINVEIGKQNQAKINKIFSLGIKIHAVIAILFFIIVEIAGLIMIPDLNIPSGKENAAYWVLQFSIFTAIVSIMTVPYDALIIANEKFNAYAVISIVEYTLKLGVIFLLIFSPVQRVIFYSALIFLVTLLVRFTNAIYCKKTFKEIAKYSKVKDDSLMKEMTKFAGWQFLGNASYSIANTGVNFVINIFGGVTINAARSIAYQVQGMIEQFTSDLNVSFRPQIVNNYAAKDMDKCLQLVLFSSKATFMITIILTFVIECMTYPILQLWLNIVPESAVIFIQTYLLFTLIHSFYYSIDVLFKASGNIKLYQLYDAAITFLNLPLSWISLKLGFPYYSVFIIMSMLEFINLIIKLFLCKKLLGFNILTFLKVVLTRVVICIIIFIILFTIHHHFIHIQYTPLSTIIFATGYGLIGSVLSFIIMFTNQERKKLISILKKQT